MKKFITSVIVLYLIVCLEGCALPTVAGDLDSYIGTPFSNPKNPNRNPVRGNSHIWSLSASGSLYYDRRPEDNNTRYYFSWYPRNIREDCRYSLLVSPEDVILSWRNEGPRHVSQCYYN